VHVPTVSRGGTPTDSDSDSAIWLKPGGGGRGYPRPRRLLLACDFTAAVVAFACAFILMRVRASSGAQLGISLLSCGVILVISLGLMLYARQYSALKPLTLPASMGVLVRDVVISAGATTLLSYLTKGFFTGLTSPSRLALGIGVGGFLLLGLLARLWLSILQRRLNRLGRGVYRVLVAGDGVVASELCQLIAERPGVGIVVAGKLRLDVPEWTQPSADLAPLPECKGPMGADLPVFTISNDLEGLRELDQALRDSQATEIVIAVDPQHQAALPRLASLLSLAHVSFRVVPALFEETYITSKLLGQDEIPVVYIGANRLDRVGRMSKRLMDICMAIGSLTVLLPLELLIVFAIVAESGPPFIFAQERVGKNGRHFLVYKFRTMVKDAEAKLEHLEAQNELTSSDGRMFKMHRDPRVTRVGSLLRRTSLDELPQFVNVLKGDMSVVGPRPPLPREVANYEAGHLYRLRVLPGITGLWQVSGRSDLDFEDMVRLDRYYVDNWSMRQDLVIVLKTIWVVMTRKGAY
jgi:exopolysaccharide biosynthesis polyprenyl glycosylphosphotransferase